MSKHGTEVGRAVLVVVVFVLTVCGSDAYGVPDELPAIALDWTLLFHVERTAALLAGIGAILLVGWRAVHGDFPVRFGQIEYAVKEAAAEAEAVAASQEQRIRVLEVLMELRDPGELDEEWRMRLENR